MATVGANAITLADWAKTVDPMGKVAKVIEILRLTNDILEDMLWMEGNLPTGHRHTVRGGLPTPTWRLLNYGVPVTKTQNVQVDDAIGMLEDYSEVDKSLADLNGNTAAFRMSQDRGHIQGMANTMASAVFYGNQATDPEKITGLAPRFNSLSAENADNVIAADGTGSDNTSIWLVVWGDQQAFGIYPKGSQAGLQVNDLGEVTLEDSNTPTGKYQGYRSHYKWDAGFALGDWRYVVRIPNIDLSNLSIDYATGANLIDLMIQATELPPDLNGKAAFYCNRGIRTWLRRQINVKSNVNLTLENFGGKRNQPAFDGIPIRRCDAILNTESLVS